MDNLSLPKEPVGSEADPLIAEQLARILAQQTEQAISMDLRQRKSDLSQAVLGFFNASKKWRQTSHEDVWNRLYRNYLGVYDPDLAAKKEPWQVKMFIPITNQIVEVIKSSLFRILFANPDQKNVAARPGGNTLQADMNDKIIRYHKDIARYSSKSNNVLHQALIYGSGFSKIYYKRVTDTRIVRVPKLSNPLMDKIFMRQPTITAYEAQEQEVVLYDAACYEDVDIYDIFPDPTGDKIDEDHPIIQRGKMTLGEIVALATAGTVFPEAVTELYASDESDKIQTDKQERKEADGENVPFAPGKPDYAKQHIVLEYYGKLPRKLVYLNDPEIPNPEALVPAKAWVALNGTVLAVEENPDRLPPFAKLDYIKIPGRFYGVGPAELVAAINQEINELRNLRVDNVNLIINRMFAVIESKLISSNDLISRPGGFVRLKSVEDIRNAIIPLDFPDVTKSSYQETFELEKQAQEVSGANKVTLGSGGSQARDINQTLGGMELIASMAGNRFAYIASQMEINYNSEVTRRFWRSIYRYITPDMVARILGPEALMVFQLEDPDSVEREYSMTTSGLLEAEDKDRKIQTLLALKQAYAGNIGFDEFEALRRILSLAKLENPEKFVRPIPGITIPGIPGQPQMGGEQNGGQGPGGDKQGGGSQSPQGV